MPQQQSEQRVTADKPAETTVQPNSGTTSDRAAKSRG